MIVLFGSSSDVDRRSLLGPVVDRAKMRCQYAPYRGMNTTLHRICLRKGLLCCPFLCAKTPIKSRCYMFMWSEQLCRALSVNKL